MIKPASLLPGAGHNYWVNTFCFIVWIERHSSLFLLGSQVLAADVSGDNGVLIDKGLRLESGGESWKILTEATLTLNWSFDGRLGTRENCYPSTAQRSSTALEY